jgi:5-methylcytosine-specific restriction enzyme subunit McrC
MMAYGELYCSSTLTLLYPHHSGLEGDGGLLADHAVTGSTKRLRVATIDIPKPSGISERLAAFIPLLALEPIPS